MQETSVPINLVKQEFYKSTEKSHVIACWVGLLLNLVWFISDYLVIKEYFVPFLLFRVLVSVISFGLLMARRQLNISIYTCMFVLVLGISVQNAYMWSVMDVAHFQQHAFAYLVLFIGVGMLVLWELRLSLLLAAATILSNVIFYSLNSTLTPDEFLINGGLLTLTVLAFCVFLIRTRYRLTYSEIRNRMELERSKQLIEESHAELVLQKIEIQRQKDTVDLKNHEITDSINYARNIQTASIPRAERFNDHFRESFVLFKPKDIVSGDFYWIHEKNGVVFYATGDCTGHGVPGGFMTMLGLSFLDEIIAGRGITDPAEVLNMLRDKIIYALNQSGGFGENKDGMDITICCVDRAKNELTYASANNDLYIIRKDDAGEKQLTKYKANRQPCGYNHLNLPFTAHSVALREGDCIYTFTDGFADQFGGPKGKKFRYKQFEEYLTEHSHESFNDQKTILNAAIEDWKGNLDQVDDILVIGVLI